MFRYRWFLLGAAAAAFLLNWLPSVRSEPWSNDHIRLSPGSPISTEELFRALDVHVWKIDVHLPHASAPPPGAQQWMSAGVEHENPGGPPQRLTSLRRSRGQSDHEEIVISISSPDPAVETSRSPRWRCYIGDPAAATTTLITNPFPEEGLAFNGAQPSADADGAVWLVKRLRSVEDRVRLRVTCSTSAGPKR